MNQTKIDAFIPAGVGKGSDLEGENVTKNYSELHKLAGVTNKAFIEFNGKPMLQYIVETLDKCDSISSITIAGQSKESFSLEVSKPVHYIAGGESTYDTFIKGIDFFNTWDEVPEYVINVSSDVPLIQPKMIDKMVNAVTNHPGKEFYWNLILAEDVEKHYPEISKVPFKLKEANFRFGDLHVFSPKVIVGRKETLESIMGNRKSVRSNIKLVGIIGLFKYLLGRLAADDLRKRVEEEYGLKAAMMITEFPEPCIDLDYAKDLENFKIWLEDKPREIGEEEGVAIIDNSTSLENYLTSRNYKKGEIPD